ncbi:3-ketoacyl-ACP reductase [soil metagenome]
MKLREAKVLVTGGSSGIGEATARLLIERCARVAVCARGEEKLRSTAREIGAVAVAADVGDESDVRRLVSRTVEELDGLDVLVNNAGRGRSAPLLESTADDYREVWETNVLGAALVAREVARHLVEHRGGSIVNVASTAGQRGFAGGGPYVSSKFALTGLTECWRAELRKHDIRVMQINPSEVLTGFGRDGQPADDPSKLHAEDIAHTIACMLEMDDRGFIPEVSVWATNPK